MLTSKMDAAMNESTQGPNLRTVSRLEAPLESYHVVDKQHQ